MPYPDGHFADIATILTASAQNEFLARPYPSGTQGVVRSWELKAYYDTLYATLAHTEHGQNLTYPGSNLRFRWENVKDIRIGNYAIVSIRLLQDAVGANQHAIYFDANNRVQANTPQLIINTGSLFTFPAASGKYVKSDQFLLWPCTRTSKRAIKPLKDVDKILKKLEGIEFETDTAHGLIVPFEDLEEAGIPGATTRDDEGLPSGLNLLAIIPIMVEELKALRNEITALQEQLEGGGE